VLPNPSTPSVTCRPASTRKEFRLSGEFVHRFSSEFKAERSDPGCVTFYSQKLWKPCGKGYFKNHKPSVKLGLIALCTVFGHYRVC
jgi:hypothetical protein